MARTAQIHYKRVTFSFPADTLDLLRKKVGKRNMSKFVAGLIEEDLLMNRTVDFEEFMAEFREFVGSLQKSKGMMKSSLETLREMRYGKK